MCHSATPFKTCFRLVLLFLILAPISGFSEEIYFTSEGKTSSLSLGDTVEAPSGGTLFLTLSDDVLNPNASVTVLTLGPNTIVAIGEHLNLKLLEGECTVLTQKMPLNISVGSKEIRAEEGGKFFFSQERDLIIAVEAGATIKEGDKQITVSPASSREVATVSLIEIETPAPADTPLNIADRPAIGVPPTATIPTTPLDSGGGSVSCK